MKYTLSGLLLLGLLAFIPSKVMAQQAIPNLDINAKVNQAFSNATLEKIAPPKSDITIAFPAQNPSQAPLQSVLKAGESWSNLPIGVVTGLPNGQNLSYASIVSELYPNPADAQKALNGSLYNFKAIEKVPLKDLVSKFPELQNAPVLPTQIGSLSGCSSGSTDTLGSLAASPCGQNPIPVDVLKAIPISQTGIQNISYKDLGSKLDLNNAPASNFPLAKQVSLAKLITPDGLNATGVNLFKLDYIDNKIPGQSGNPIKGLNSIVGSNRVENSTCKEADCDYAVLLSFVAPDMKENPYNHALAFQINKSGTTWLDGGIGSIGRTLWNFKEPPGGKLLGSFSDYGKLVLENGDAKKGTVEQKLYLAFCMQITFPFYSEWNCSSKFIGPIPLPWEEISEKSQAMMFPFEVKLPAAAVTPPAVAAISSPPKIPSSIAQIQSPASASQSSSPNQSPTPTYNRLFGSNTLASYSPIANITRA
jgi:hypothetical protein